MRRAVIANLFFVALMASVSLFAHEAPYYHRIDTGDEWLNRKVRPYDHSAEYSVFFEDIIPQFKDEKELYRLAQAVHCLATADLSYPSGFDDVTRRLMNVLSWTQTEVAFDIISSCWKSPALPLIDKAEVVRALANTQNPKAVPHLLDALRDAESSLSAALSSAEAGDMDSEEDVCASFLLVCWVALSTYEKQEEVRAAVKASLEQFEEKYGKTKFGHKLLKEFQERKGSELCDFENFQRMVMFRRTSKSDDKADSNLAAVSDAVSRLLITAESTKGKRFAIQVGGEEKQIPLLPVKELEKEPPISLTPPKEFLRIIAEGIYGKKIIDADKKIILQAAEEDVIYGVSSSHSGKKFWVHRSGANHEIRSIANPDKATKIPTIPNSYPQGFGCAWHWMTESILVGEAEISFSSKDLKMTTAAEMEEGVTVRSFLFTYNCDTGKLAQLVLPDKIPAVFYIEEAKERYIKIRSNPHTDNSKIHYLEIPKTKK